MFGTWPVQLLKTSRDILKPVNHHMVYKCPLSLGYKSENLEAIKKVTHRELTKKSQPIHKREHRATASNNVTADDGKVC